MVAQKPVSMKQLAQNYSLDPDLYGLRRSNRSKNSNNYQEVIHYHQIHTFNIQNK